MKMLNRDIYEDNSSPLDSTCEFENALKEL
jgi:hypothetical protein